MCFCLAFNVQPVIIVVWIYLVFYPAQFKNGAKQRSHNILQSYLNKFRKSVEGGGILPGF